MWEVEALLGSWNEFMDTHAEFIGVEAGGPKSSKLHAAPLTNGSKVGILHGAAQWLYRTKRVRLAQLIQYLQGLITGNSSFALFFKDSKRQIYFCKWWGGSKAYQLFPKLENISPSLEPSHAFAAIKLAPKLKSSEIIIANSCGDSLKDKDIIKQKLDHT